MVFAVAFTVIALETASFQLLSFVNDWLTATQVLSVALMGIALGGVASWLVRPTPIVLALFPLSVLGSFFVMARLSAYPVPMMAALTAPYVLASLVISWMFNSQQPARVYLYDLLGAGLGALVVVLAVPLLREEGTFFLLTGISVVPLWLWWGLRHTEPVPKWVRNVALGFGALSGLLLVLHVAVDPFNLMYFARADIEKHRSKLFQHTYTAAGEKRWDVLYSRGSLIERIDIVKKADGTGSLLSVYNGRAVDAITSDKARYGRLDNRMPTWLTLGEDPDTLLVGPSGQGLCKAVQALGDGDIDAVEINGAIARLMSGPLYRRSGRAYEGMDLHIEDVRAFLARTERQYDWITLLNTHRIWSMGHQGPPEYVHTLEAFESYFDHLADDGYLLLEERNINEQADLGILRMIGTVKEALRQRGVDSPADHFVIWELWHGCSPQRWFKRAPGQLCDQKKRFTFLMVKKTPFTEDEITHLEGWGRRLGMRTMGSQPPLEYRGVVWRHLPRQKGIKLNAFKRAVIGEDLGQLRKVDPAKHNMSVVTDDVPYPWNVFTDNASAKELLRNVAALAFGMVLLPTLLGFFVRERGQEQAGPVAWLTNSLLAVYFAVLGVAYLLIEIVLMQKFAIFLSSPIYAVVVVLATMLVASGIGGYVSRDWTRRQVVASIVVAALGAGLLSGVDPLLHSLMGVGLPFLLRCAVSALLIGAVAFLMGAPFPFGLRLAKELLSERHAGLMFGINGAAAAVAAPLSILLAAEYGFTTALQLGAALYAVCLVLLMLVPRPR